jgi:hypothetical protein
MVLLSYGFGFMSRTTAEKLASTSSERAVIAVFAPVCADKFRALPDVAARTATLVANKDSSWEMRKAFPETLINAARQKLSGFGPDHRMCRPDSRTA